jgi:hypothetical protein
MIIVDFGKFFVKMEKSIFVKKKLLN